MINLKFNSIMFQSLTGSIHTGWNSTCYDEIKVFQSLTGSIHTCHPKNHFFQEKAFQSLTGSIHTGVKQLKKWKRLCFNPSQVQFTHLVCEVYVDGEFVFQSLTGSIHTGMYIDEEKRENMFQSLTGSIHTISPTPSLFTLTCFNPSQVQFTQFILNLTAQNLALFQSLTGSIHTINPV